MGPTRTDLYLYTPLTPQLQFPREVLCSLTQIKKQTGNLMVQDEIVDTRAPKSPI